MEAAKIACLDGWHLSTDIEWTQLVKYLSENGYSYNGVIVAYEVAKSLATDNAWTSSDVEGDVGNSDFSEYRNKSGFSSFPEGNRYYVGGTFNYMGNGSFWWSNTEWDSWFAYSYYPIVFNRPLSKLDGLSVRCIKN